MSREGRPTLGSFYLSLDGDGRDGPVFGAAVAARAMLNAVLEHGDAEHVHLFTESSRRGAARSDLARGAHRARAAHTVHGLDALAHLDELDLTAWHDTNADVVRPFLARRAGARRLFPITVTHHTISYGRQLHDWYLSLLLGDVRPCDAVICTSSAARRAIETILLQLGERLARDRGIELSYRGRLETIPLGVDTELYRPRDRSDVRQQLGLPIDATLVGWIGRVSARDKADLLPLLEVFRRIAVEQPDPKRYLVVAGKALPPFGDALEQHIEALGLTGRVIVQGSVSPAQSHLWHAALDVFVSPVDNIQETFGLTPIEAMACGVPQVVSDWDGYRDTVVDGETGYLVPTYGAAGDADLWPLAPIVGWARDHFAIAQSVVVDLPILQARLAELLADPGRRAAMGEASRRRAVREFDWRVVLARHAALWRELSARAASEAPAPGADYRCPAPWAAFGHYASRAIEPGQSVSVGAAGRAVLAGELGLPLYYAELEVIDEALIEAALVLLGEAGPLAWSQLVDRLARERGCVPSVAARHAAWLLKYGLGELAG